MKTLMLATISLSLLLLTNTSCSKNHWKCVDGQGELVKQERVVSDFTGIKLKMSGDVIVTVDPNAKTPKVEVEAQANIQEHIDLDVNSNTLVIDNGECIRNHKRITVHITTDDLSEVRVSGSGNVVINNTLETNSFHASISGSGDIRGQIVSQDASASIAGSGDINLSGTTKNLEVSIAGSGEFYGRALEAANADMSISGSGDINCHVSENLEVSISGSGSVNYLGSPSIETSIAGSGKVKKLN
ncbi:DUF2807 domain-containing protein [bacterium SCSIO 12741]|nr:DUF2807 domain-containing protein [bacterium SCSIO 12741]